MKLSQKSLEMQYAIIFKKARNICYTLINKVGKNIKTSGEKTPILHKNFFQANELLQKIMKIEISLEQRQQENMLSSEDIKLIKNYISIIDKT